MVLGSIPAFFRGLFGSFSGFIFSSSNTRSMLCQENARGLVVTFFQGAAQNSVSICHSANTKSALMMTWSQSCRGKRRNTEKNGYKNPAKNTMSSPKIDTIVQEKLMRESASADFISVASLILEINGSSSQTSHEMVLLVKLVREKIIKAFRKKTFFTLVCMNVSAPGRQESLMLHESSKIGMNVKHLIISLYSPL